MEVRDVNYAQPEELMTPAELAALVAIVFALVLIFAFSRYRRAIRGRILGPFGTQLQVDGNNDPPAIEPAIKAHDLTSTEGGISATDHTERGIDMRKASAKRSIELEVGGGDRPKAPPRS